MIKRKDFIRQATSEPLEHWNEEIEAEKRRFHDLAGKVGLPWIDKEDYQKQLLTAARVTELPKIKSLNDTLEKQWDLSLAIRSAIGERENVRFRLFSETCALKEDGGPMHNRPFPSSRRLKNMTPRSLAVSGRAPTVTPLTRNISTHSINSSVGTQSETDETDIDMVCSVSNHRHCAELLRAMDDITDEVLSLIRQWRRQLNRPLPFFVRQQNYLLQLVKDCTVGGVFPLVSGHLRGTCRHLNFFYASTYDAIAASTMNITTPDLEYLLAEGPRQIDLISEQLTLSKMGVYLPVLKFNCRPADRNAIPRALNQSGALGAGSPRNNRSRQLNRSAASTSVVSSGVKGRETLIHINQKAWKQQLIASYSSALQLVRRQAATANVDSETTAAATQFLFFSSRTMHIRYFRRWVEWQTERKQRKTRVLTFLHETTNLHIRRRFGTWQQRALISRDYNQKLQKLHTANDMVLRHRFMSQWYVQSRLVSVGRAARRGLYLRYYESLFYAVVRKRIRKQITPGASSSDALKSLHMVSILKPSSKRLFLVRNTHTSLRPFLYVGQQETNFRAEIAEQEKVQHSTLISNIYRRWFMAHIQIMCTPRLAIYDDYQLPEEIMANQIEQGLPDRLLLAGLMDYKPGVESHKVQVLSLMQFAVCSLEAEQRKPAVEDLEAEQRTALQEDLVATLLRTTSDQEAKARCALVWEYEDFVAEYFELTDLSVLVMQRRMLQARERRSRQGYWRRFCLGLEAVAKMQKEKREQREQAVLVAGGLRTQVKAKSRFKARGEAQRKKEEEGEQKGNASEKLEGKAGEESPSSTMSRSPTSPEKVKAVKVIQSSQRKEVALSEVRSLSSSRESSPAGKEARKAENVDTLLTETPAGETSARSEGIVAGTSPEKVKAVKVIQSSQRKEVALSEVRSLSYSREYSPVSQAETVDTPLTPETPAGETSRTPVSPGKGSLSPASPEKVKAVRVIQSSQRKEVALSEVRSLSSSREYSPVEKEARKAETVDTPLTPETFSVEV